MRAINRVIALVVFITLGVFPAVSQDNDPKLLLTPRRLHRLKLDMQRQTDRWTNFEQRVKTVLDSPERGFELALYSAVTGDAPACKAALTWGVAHLQEKRQTALVADWCRATLGEAERNRLMGEPMREDQGSPFSAARDWLFARLAVGDVSRDEVRQRWSRLLPLLQADPRVCVREGYALFEFLDATDKNLRLDLRQDDSRLFASLPYIFLLAQRPGQMEQPDWATRAAGLMMVNVDPNLQASAFVQGWAMEDPKMARDGPGVAYELLWANPYLPGLGYFNMEPWVYDPPSSLLIVRKSWETDSCWFSIYKGRTEAMQCTATPLAKEEQFGKLTVIPMTDLCTELKRRSSGTILLSGMKPGTVLTWEADNQHLSGHADESGLYLPSSTTMGKVCRASSTVRGNGSRH